MPIRASLVTIVTGFFVVMLSGGLTPSAAEPDFYDPALIEFASPAASQEPEASPREASAPVPAAPETQVSSIRVSPEIDLPKADAVIERDPWAEALAESASLQVSPTDSASPYPDYAVELNAQVLRFLDRFTGSRRDVVEMWLTRSGRYLDMIRETFEGHGLPTDLAFTAMIESGFNPLAVSRAGAKGLWQFMAQTARRYGLRVDRWVDERLDPDKSTRAAAAYLRDLYTQFGSWTLAQAAYNAGEVAISRAIRKTGSSDFWVLNRTKYLRRETQDFVPAIQAATIIGRNPQRYGFDAAEASPRDHDRVKVPPKTDLRRLARASGLSFTTLRSLNPVLVRGVTPPGDSWELKVPAGAGEGVAAALAKRHRAKPKGGVHVVRARETVSSIAKHYGVSISDVLRWNSLTERALIRPGDRLRIAELH